MYCPNCGKKIHDNSIICDYCHAIVNDYRDLGIEPLDLGSPYKKAIADAETEAKKAKRTFLIATVLLPFIAGILGAMVWPLAIVCLGIWAVLGFKLLSCNMKVDKANRAYVKYASDNAERWRKAEEEDARRKSSRKNVFVDPDSNFVYPELLKAVKSYFKKDFNGDNGMIEVQYDNETVMQIIDWTDGRTGKAHDICLFCFPYFIDEETGDRFKMNYYRKDFKMDTDRSYTAYYGNDVEQAVKVASYILATVYWIPTDALLDLGFETIS